VNAEPCSVIFARSNSSQDRPPLGTLDKLIRNAGLWFKYEQTTVEPRS
jgi:hypothetical protein